MKNRLALWIFSSLLLFGSCKKDIQATSFDHQNASSNALQSAIVSNAKQGPIGVCYVEANNNNLLNTGAYQLAKGGQQLFDLAIIFAANINYDASTGRTILYSNNNVTKVLTNRDIYIKPLQDKGIKVTLSVLGNHQGAGITNLTSRATAHDFARQLALTVETYGLDGIDFDDEYSDYGNNNTGQPNDSSFVMLTQELRALMPGKIISFYYYGPAATKQTYNGQRVGDYVDYSWNANYGTYSVPKVPPLGKNQLGPAAIWINNTLATIATTYAARTVLDGYGVYLYYDLHDYDESNYLSGPAVAMYNDSAKLTSPIQGWSQGSGPDAPHDLSISNITYNSATLSWSPVSGVKSYSVEYKASDSANWVSAATSETGNSIVLQGLSPATLYDWRIKSNGDNGSSTYSFSGFKTNALAGVVFYQNTTYGSTATREIPKGLYTLSQLKAYGFIDNWASSVQIPAGFTVVMYKDDNFKKTSWTLLESTPDFTTLSPNANEQVSSVKIQ